MQYTLRNIPKRLDEALRAKAKVDGRSLNEVAVDALARGIGVSGQPVLNHDLDWIAGTWVEDPAYDEMQKTFEVILPEEWPGMTVPPPGNSPLAKGAKGRRR